MSGAIENCLAKSVFYGVELPEPLRVSKSQLYTLAGNVLGHECVCAIGVFDGLHKGHRTLIEAAREDALRRRVPLVVVTFDPDPAEVLFDRAPRLLLQDADRLCALASLEPDALMVHAFTPQFAALTAQDYIEEALLPSVYPVAIHVGSDFGLGARGEGHVNDLAALGQQHGFEVVAHQLVTHGGAPITATRIRSLIEAARLDEAQTLLGRNHFLRGEVIHGRGEGAGFGFPTANLRLSAKDCLPADGVYGCYIIDGARAWPAAVNVGAPPSFATKSAPLLEANLLGFNDNLYGHTLSCVFIKHLRPSMQFGDLEELKRTVFHDIEWVRIHLGETMLEVDCDI